VNKQRAHYFDKTVHHPKIKEAISGKNEESIIEILKMNEYHLGEDYVRQHPIASLYVIDFAFINEQIVIEVDGTNHDTKKQMKKDRSRDFYLRSNGWVVIRIADRNFQKNPAFFRYLIKEIVEERREQYRNFILERDYFDE
jgi:very-short-patch-repair endonuclease